MFNTMYELVKAQQTTSPDNFDYLNYNKSLLEYHQSLLDLHTGSRSVCIYSLKPTRVRCTKCNRCKGSVLYHLWFLNSQINDCLEILNDNRQGLEFKEACFFHLKRYRAERLEALKEARSLGL